MGKSEYIMFVNETNKTNESDIFCLSGLIIKRSDYENNIISQLNNLKTKYFGKTNIIFHYTKMKKPKYNYPELTDPITRNQFYMDLVKIFNNNSITIVSSYFNKTYMNTLYDELTYSDYNVAFKYLIESFMHFLKKNNGSGMIIMESRLFSQNQMLQKTFNDYINNGSELFKANVIEKYIRCLGFIVKNENCAGLQLVDFVPSTIVRILNKEQDKFSMQKTISGKIYYANTKYQNLIGLRNILGEIEKEEEKSDKH